VLTATSTESVLQLFLNNHIDAVITDWDMGKITGDVIRSLSELRPGIPIIVFSGAADIPERVLSIIGSVVPKSDLTMLVSELAQLLERPCA
jgi:DNA-binding response OmpR family regulator